MRRAKTAWARRLRTFRRNSDGVAAIEFAFIAPILIIFVFGVFELGRAYSAHRRFMGAAYMIGDLVTREKQVALGATCLSTPPATGECLRGIYKLAKPALANFASDTGTFKVSVFPIFQYQATPTAAKEYLVYATPEGYDLTTKPSCGTPPFAIKDDVKSVLQTTAVVVIRATYEFKPIFSYPLIGNMTWSYDTTVSPRQGCVAFTGGTTCSKAPPAC